MRFNKPNNAGYSEALKYSGYARSANILDLIKRNKQEEKKEKVQKIYTIIGLVGSLLILAAIIYL